MTALYLEDYLEKVNEGIRHHHDYSQGMRVYDVTRDSETKKLIYWRDLAPESQGVKANIYQQVIQEVKERIEREYALILP